jgi:hypothetical protein
VRDVRLRRDLVPTTHGRRKPQASHRTLDATLAHRPAAGLQCSEHSGAAVPLVAAFKELLHPRTELLVGDRPRTRRSGSVRVIALP